MKLRFRRQKFQEDAARAVADVFAGQPYRTPANRTDRVVGEALLPRPAGCDGWSNPPVVPELTDARVLENLRRVQRANRIKPSEKLEGRYNLTVEMETGTGKTYTYIKTLYELNGRYGWSKFIVVVPSVAIREGVYKSFQVMQDHFAEEYGRKVRYFIYDSSQMTEIDRFASDRSIDVMIINAQAFNARGRDARRIHMRLDEFRSRRPIEVIAGTHPIVIIDEPQSVEGRRTREGLRQFNPLMTLRYSATHRPDSLYNLVYRLDAMEAYNERLVKKIAVKGIVETGGAATEGYVYLQGVNLSRAAPTATVQFDCRGTSGVRQVTRTAGVGYDLYERSGRLEEYRDGFVVKSVDGRDNSVEFLNGVRLCAGEAVGRLNEDRLRRIQIRETILSHIERERRLFRRGIKVLSLFFIDEVAHYREYDADGRPQNGLFARMFEDEYRDVVSVTRGGPGEEEYMEYLGAIAPDSTHAGYFSIDGRGRMTNGSLSDRRECTSDDIDAYDLIMRDKERLLDGDPRRSPVRFIFSHSALREGWDNPNVFQICTLKRSGSEVRKRQEVGRGLRLCVNQDGERMDAEALGDEVHDVNVLTIIASESYDSFARGLQAELADEAAGAAEAVVAPPRSVLDVRVLQPEDARSAEPTMGPEKRAKAELQAQWSGVDEKPVCAVDFDADALIWRAVRALNGGLRLPKALVRVESGVLGTMVSKEGLWSGTSFAREGVEVYEASGGAGARNVKYDLIGRLVEATDLTRRDVVTVLTGIAAPVFEQFKDAPEEFILRAASLINGEKATMTGRRGAVCDVADGASGVTGVTDVD